MNPFTPEQQRDIASSVDDMLDVKEDWGGLSLGFVSLPNGQIAEVQLIVTTNPDKFIDVSLLEHNG